MCVCECESNNNSNNNNNDNNNSNNNEKLLHTHLSLLPVVPTAAPTLFCFDTLPVVAVFVSVVPVAVGVVVGDE